MARGRGPIGALPRRQKCWWSGLTSVGGRLLTIGLDLHAASDARVGFSSGQIGDVNESVVERGLDVADTEDVLSVLAGLSVGGTVVGHLLLLGLISTLLLCFGLNRQKMAQVSITASESIRSANWRHSAHHNSPARSLTRKLARPTDHTAWSQGLCCVQARPKRGQVAPTILLLVLY